MNSYIYGQLILNKAGKDIQWGKKRYSWDTCMAPQRVTVDSAPIMISGQCRAYSLSPFLSAPLLHVLSLSLSLSLSVSLSLSLSLKNKYINLKQKSPQHVVLEKLDSNLQNKTKTQTDHFLITYTKINPT